MVFMKNFIPLHKNLKKFIAAVTLISVFGGYQLNQLINTLHDDFLRRTEKILAMERSLGEAATSLGRQIQEWKDMLLRINDTELYRKHRQAFLSYGNKVQVALKQTQIAMQADGMATDEIQQLLVEHQSLSSDYLFANSVLDPGQINSYLETDKLVIGVDRKLQQHLAILKSDIQRFSNQKLNEKLPAAENRYLLGLVGALSLIIMALAGYLFANRIQVDESKTTE